MGLNRKHLALVLGAEIFGSLNAVFAFRYLDRPVAAFYAALTFVLLAFLICGLVYAGGRAQRYFTFWANLVQLGIFAGPMLIVRTLNSEVPFSEISIFGLSGPLFHGISEGFYCVLLLSTIVDLVRNPVLRE